MAYYEQYPEEVLALQAELNHPHWKALQAWLVNECQEMAKLDTVLGMLAARLGIALDGHYMLPKLCKTLAEEMLRRRRQAEMAIDLGKEKGEEPETQPSPSSIILPGSPGFH